MLQMNGKEVNNLIINGERFTKPYDDLIGKNMKIYSKGYSKQPIEVHGDDYSSYHDYTYYFTPSGFDIKGNVVPFQIVKITGWRYATTSDDWQGLWLSGYIRDTTNLLRSGGWIKASDVEILESGGVNKPSYLLFIYELEDVREVTPSWL